MDSIRRSNALLAGVIGLVMVVLQLVVYLRGGVAPVGVMLLRFFCYFTILTNLLAAVVFVRIGLWRLGSASLVTAVTGYMLVVGIIHYFFLRGLRELNGAGLVADMFLHVVLPFSCLVYWVMWVEKGGLKWRSAFVWLGYPLGYILWIMVVGAVTGFYPYPFANVGNLGYPRALANGGMILAGSWVVFAVLIGMGRKLPLSRKLP